MFGTLSEATQEILDSLAVTLNALKVSHAMLPEKRTDVFIVLPTPNIGIKFRNLASSPQLEIKIAKAIDDVCGAQTWLKKRLPAATVDMDSDDAVKQAVVGSGIEELEQVELKLPMQRLRLQKDRHLWRLAMTSQNVQVEISTFDVALDARPVHKDVYFTICVESKSIDALVECVVKLALGEMLEPYAMQNIFVVESINVKTPGARAPPSPKKKAVIDPPGTMVPPSSSPAAMDPKLSPVKRKLISIAPRLRLMEMGYSAFVCNVVQVAMH
ncbi:hypothetical protein SDRG_16045 [Saprolegnia diclina VS20]|uniref:Uncharacterized protein n=1 Tax=Saprolegnia diclina (strain VS20) TaxID=1156394 RepID=T0R249_SAPDV|nr:hypothetical protein SDRG_16045 [Saprolegnia diclina VS20]EQC26093.1 hypothetical protein SDRG_16045 [Saprolegnia diclina VS20]|eukprot:XP_008620460.1 hypothetical protein SDRG_16045 [Saprolegnia diclina VS20]